MNSSTYNINILAKLKSNPVVKKDILYIAFENLRLQSLISMSRSNFLERQLLSQFGTNC